MPSMPIGEATTTVPYYAGTISFSNSPSEDLIARPFLKWAGGKSQILSEIRARYPLGLGETITKYAEPFVGAGAVLFDILSQYNLKEVYISDINKELISTYLVIRDSIDKLIAKLKLLEGQYLSADESIRKVIYYVNRDQFNQLQKNGGSLIELAALFVFLNRTCFNGLYRVNSHGAYNVPRGSYKNPTICDESNLRSVSNKLKRVDIVCADYKQSRDFIDSNTFAYFDPPYRPLSSTASFTAYTSDSFGDSKQIELAYFIDEMSNRGASILTSNSDPKNINEYDNFFDKLYSHYNITRISAKRAINSIGSSRGRISELLISN